MACFEVTLCDRTTERVGGADAYQQEGPMTTFFRTGESARVDSWSVRVASVRTADVLLIRRVADGLFDDLTFTDDRLTDDRLFDEVAEPLALRSA